MNPRHLTTASYVASASGIVLLALSFVFPYVFTDRGAWSDESAEELRAASADLHRLTHTHGEGDAEEPAELAAARTRFEASKQELESTLGGRQTLRSVIKWLGMLLCIGGIGSAVILRFGDAGA